MVLGHDAIIKALGSGDIYCSGMPDPVEEKRRFKEWCKEYVQPASIDLPIGDTLYFVPAPSGAVGQVSFNPQFPPIRTTNAAEEYFVKKRFSDTDDSALVLSRGQSVLAHTEWVIGLSGNFAAQVATRSTARRWGLDVCGSAGWVDPGYRARITLEITNTQNRDIYLRAGVAYAQLIFFEVNGAGKEYTGHYNGGDAWDESFMLPKEL